MYQQISDRQVLPPIHEALLPIRHNYFSSSIRDALSLSTARQSGSLMETKASDTSHNLYYRQTLYKTSSADTASFTSSSQSSTGLQPIENSYTLSDSSCNYSLDANNTIYSSPVSTQCPTTMRCDLSSYTIPSMSGTAAAPATSGIQTVLTAQESLTASSAEYQQPVQKQHYECHVEQSGQPQNILTTSAISNGKMSSTTVDQCSGKAECLSPRQRTFTSTANTNNVCVPHGSLVSHGINNVQQNLMVQTTLAQCNVEVTSESSQQFPPHRAVTKTYENSERKPARCKKEVENTANVEEEVARNVTKILCASLKQKGLRHYPSSVNGHGTFHDNPCTSGTFVDCNATESTPIGVLLGRKHICNACNKAFTSLRNLQRHRTNCKSIFAPGNPLETTRRSTVSELSTTQQLSKIQQTSTNADCGTSSAPFNMNCQPLTAVQTYAIDDAVTDTVIRKEPEKIVKSNDGMGPQCEDSFLDNAVAEMSHNNDFDLITNGSITPHLLDVGDSSLSPLAFRDESEITQESQVAESQSYNLTDTLLMSVSEPSSMPTSNSTSNARVFKCEYCNKTVSSSRSLKRHQNTCKSYQNFVKDTSVVTSPLQTGSSKPSSSGTAVAELPSCTENTTTVINCNDSFDDSCATQLSSLSSPGTTKVSMQSRRVSSGNLNICEDCNKVLCSASNLKRHRGTCKAANLRNSNSDNGSKLTHAHSDPSTPNAPSSFERLEDTENTVASQSTAVAPPTQKLQVPASRGRRRVSSGGNGTYTVCNKNTIAVLPPQNLTTTTSLSSMTPGGLNLEVVASKPWITVGEHLKAQHTQRINQQRQLEEQKRAEMQIIAENKAQSCNVLKCVPLNQTYICSIQPDSTKQPNLILWSQGSNVVNQNSVITVMTTSADSSIVTIPSATSSSPICTEQPLKTAIFSEREKKYSYDSTFGRMNGTVFSSVSSSSQLQSLTKSKSGETTRGKKKEVRLLNSTITTVPLPNNRYSTSATAITNRVEPTGTTTTYLQKVNNKIVLELPAEPIDFRFECPECFKTYSCRKNVKRHRMAVHKLSADDVAKTEPVKVLVSNDVDYKRQRQYTVSQLEERSTENYVTEVNQVKQEESDEITTSSVQRVSVVGEAPNLNGEMSMVYSQAPTVLPVSDVSTPITTASTVPAPIEGQCWSAPVPVTQSMQNLPTSCQQLSADETVQLAKIEEDLRRSAEFKLANINEPDSESEIKKPVAELAEADTTTLSEDCDDLNNHLPSHPGSVQCNGNVLSLPSPSNINCPSFSVPDMNTVSCVTSSPSGGLASQLPPIRSPLPPVQQIIYQPSPALPETKTRVSLGGSIPNSNRSQPRSRSHNNVPKAKQPHICADCNRTLSSDYSLKRHRSTCVEVKANAAAKAAAERSKDGGHLLQGSNGNQQISYGTDTAGTSQLGISDLTGNGQSLRMSQHLSPLIDKHSEVVMTQPFSTFEDDADTGVMCQICDCWLSGRREFDRHCEQRHPIVVDADSTTVVHSYDQSMTPPSAFLMHSPNSDIGSGSPAPCSPTGTRKRNRYGSPGETSSSGSKTSKHLCLMTAFQACGKYYSSEWNLERHRRESCPLKAKRSKVNEEKVPRLSKLETLELPPLRLNDAKWVADCYLLIGDTRVPASKSVLSTSSTYFASLFQYYDGENEIPLPEIVDPGAFSLSMEVLNGHQSLEERTIDFVMYIADKFGIKGLYEKCETFVAEKLPASSVMHAIRLADEYNMSDLKNALFSSISIDVFRGLSADRDYCLMEPELKAELLEKWGTFL